MDLKKAFTQMKASRGTPLHYFFVEGGADGKPVLVVSKKKIPPEEKKEHLGSAKKKTKSGGTMSINEGGELEIVPKGPPPGNLAKCVQIAARNASAMVFSGINVMKETPEEEEEEGQENRNEPQSDGGALRNDAPTGGVGYTDSLAMGGNYTSSNPFDFVDDSDDDDGDDDDDDDDDDGDDFPVAVPETKPRITKEFIQKMKTSAAKKFPDALAADPEIGGILKERDEAKKTLVKLLAGGENTPLNELEKAADNLDQIDVRLETAQRRLNDQGVSPQQRRPEYADEDKQLGAWRISDETKKKVNTPPTRGDTETDEQFNERQQQHAELKRKYEELVKSKIRTTRMFDDDQRENSKLNVGTDGKLTGAESFEDDGSGKEWTEAPLDTGYESRHVVMDKDGQLYQFEQAAEKTGNQVRNPMTGNLVDSDEVTHHSSVLAGEEVAGAGTLKARGGKITEISNASGHYKPGIAQMIQMVETLLKQGALLNQNWVDGQGNPPTGKAAALVESVIKLEKAIEPDVAEMRKLTKDGGESEELNKLSEVLKPKLQQLTQARQMLGKLGIGPSNKMSDAKVAFIDGADKKTGLGVHNAEVESSLKASTVQDFLSSGGGNVDTAPQKLGAKANMLDELKMKTAKTRETLDRDAEDRSRRLKETEAQLEKQLKEPIPDNLPENERVKLEKLREVQKKMLAKFKASSTPPTDEQLEVLTRSLDQTRSLSQLQPDDDEEESWDDDDDDEPVKFPEFNMWKSMSIHVDKETADAVGMSLEDLKNLAAGDDLWPDMLARHLKMSEQDLYEKLKTASEE